MDKSNAEMVMIRGLTAITADCEDFDFSRMMFNATFFYPESAEVTSARKRLTGLLKELEMDGSTWMKLLNAITILVDESIREGYSRGCNDAFSIQK